MMSRRTFHAFFTSTDAGSKACNLAGRIPGGVVRVFSDPETCEVIPGSFIPYCSMAQAQLSFHGHRDAVKFFVAVPGNCSLSYLVYLRLFATTRREYHIVPDLFSGNGGISAATTVPRESPIVEDVSENELLPSMLVISGGEGYIDFRTGRYRRASIFTALFYSVILRNTVRRYEMLHDYRHHSRVSSFLMMK